MTLIEELKWRDLYFDMTDPDLEQKLEEESLTFYLGADPTADSLHVGHLLSFLVAKRLQDNGHNPILLVGGGTGLIGDPSGKKNERKLLTIEDSLKNAKGIASQVRHILPDATIVNNYDWISKFSVIEFLRDIGKHFNINYMISKDSVKSRLDQGISFTEFSYQIIQSLDFMHLYKEENCSMQIGGQEQWGNITAGLELIRKVLGSDEKAYGYTWPLLTKADGTKFGKTESGAIWLDPLKTSPYEFYQFWINTKDEDAVSYLKKFTFFSKEETTRLIEEFKQAPHKRLLQHKVAEEMCVLIHGEEAYESALRISKALFNNDIKSLSEAELQDGFKDVPSYTTKSEIGLVDLLIQAKLAPSKRQAREFISNGAVRVNGEKITDTYFTVKQEDALFKQYTILRRGKKKYVMIQH